MFGRQTITVVTVPLFSSLVSFNKTNWDHSFDFTLCKNLGFCIGFGYWNNATKPYKWQTSERC